jgi:hypothetical protein
MTTWTSAVPRGLSQFSGLLSPVSPSKLARAAIPTWNSGEKLSSESFGTPSAFKPWKVMAILTQVSPSGLVGLMAEETTDPARRSNSLAAPRSSI